MSKAHDRYVACSYNFASDRPFVGWLCERFERAGIPVWFLDSFDENAVTRFLPESRRDKRYPDDWRLKLQNWQATYLSQIQYAQGVLVVLSDEAVASRSTRGRGMWREIDAVEFIQNDNPLRVKSVENPSPFSTPQDDSEVDVEQLCAWARQVLRLPPVKRYSVSMQERESFNLRQSSPGPIQAPETKTRHTDWYELVRLDLYDVMWFCRRCGTESANYIMVEETPPRICPVCGFEPYDSSYYSAGLTLLPGSEKPSFSSEAESRAFHMDIVKKTVQVTKLSESALKLRKEGKHAEALETTFELEKVSRGLHNLEPLAESLWSQAITAHQADALVPAAELYGHAERVVREMGDKAVLHYCLGNLGSILVDFGCLDTALERYQEKEKLCRELRDAHGLEKSLHNQASVLFKQRRFKAALGLLEQQQTICKETRNEEGLRFSLKLQAEIENHIAEDGAN